MGFTGMFSVETVLKIIGFGIKVGIQNTYTVFFKLLNEIEGKILTVTILIISRMFS